MAMSGHDDELMARAARALRDEPKTGWIDISDAVLSRLQATTRHTWPVRATTADLPGQERLDDDRDQLHVSDQVVVNAIRIALRQAKGIAPQRIDLTLDADRCLGARLELVAAYGTDLDDAAQQARQLTLGVLLELLGPPPAGLADGVAVDLHVGDLTETDPNQ